MTNRAPSSKALPLPRQSVEREFHSPYASDEERIARCTAWYEGDSQDSIDEPAQLPGTLTRP